MTDRELLEAAANAFGTKWKWVQAPRYGAEEVPGMHHFDAVNEVDYYFAWNPLEDDGDALRLMIKLRMDFHSDSAGVMAVNFSDGYEEPFKGDEMAATRRAITRAAAALAVSDLAKMEGAK